MEDRGTTEVNRLTEEQEKILQLLRYAFQISQGDAGTQSTILRWLSMTKHLDFKTLVEVPADAVMRYIMPPKQHKDGANPAEEYTYTMSNIKDVLIPSLDKKVEISCLERDILIGMLKKDIDFQEKERENRLTQNSTDSTEAIVPDSLSDPHGSYVRKYLISGSPIIESHSSARQVYDELFSRLRGELENQHVRFFDTNAVTQENRFTQESIILLSLRKLADKWQINHPRQTFFPSYKELKV